MGDTEYYIEQLNKINAVEASTLRVALRSENGQTHWMDINASSLEVLIACLTYRLEMTK